MNNQTNSSRLTKQRQLVRTLRSQILQGHYAPGQRLPTRVELESMYDVGWFTIQQAFDMLRREGFVRTDGRRGTFVVDRPPHLHRYGLVFQRRVDGSRAWSQFFVALEAAAAQIHEDHQDIDWAMFHVEDRMDEDYTNLVRQINSHRLAGLVFAVPPLRLGSTPIVQALGIDRVVVTSRTTNENLPAIHFDYASLVRQSVEALVSRGRKRLALIAARPDKHHVEHFMAAAKEMGAVTKPAWCQVIHESHVSMAGNLIDLLMNDRPKDQRPDGILILDDNLVEHVTYRLVEQGIRVAADLDVVAFCNFPAPSQSAFPVIRIGFDNRQLLTTAIDILKGHAPRPAVGKATLLEPVFESQLVQSMS